MRMDSLRFLAPVKILWANFAVTAEGLRVWISHENQRSSSRLMVIMISGRSSRKYSSGCQFMPQSLLLTVSLTTVRLWIWIGVGLFKVSYCFWSIQPSQLLLLWNPHLLNEWCHVMVNFWQEERSNFNEYEEWSFK